MVTIAEFQGEKMSWLKLLKSFVSSAESYSPKSCIREGEVMRCLRGLSSGPCDYGHTTVQFL